MGSNSSPPKEEVTELPDYLSVESGYQPRVETRHLETLQPHPLNERTYGDRTDLKETFLDSIENNGIHTPLIVTPTDLIISGHRRWEAGKQLDLEIVPVIVQEFADELDQKEALIDLNRQRDKTFSQKMRESEVLHEIEAARARQRQGQRTDLRENVPDSEVSEFARTRDVVAEKINIGSGKTYDYARTVWEAAQDDDPVAVNQVNKLDRGDQSISGAYKMVHQRHPSESSDTGTPSAATPTDKDGTSSDKGEILSPDELILSAHIGTNEDLFPDILDLHVEKGAVIADVTFGKGVFWKQVDVDAYELRATDIQPERSPSDNSGVNYHDLPYDDSELDSVVFDPPYASGLYNEDRRDGDEEAWIVEQYGTVFEGKRTGHDAVLHEYAGGAKEAKRVLREGGTYIVKTMDEVASGKQHLTHVEIIEICEELGFTTTDLFVLVGQTTPSSQGIVTQQHARKNHSYFLVFTA
ncbi:ParB/RepB/Spo0J family partition protein [Natronorubrum thiooxidans]|uniref:ParB/RepB/Spo0J family partition protein n=1 Tax=Natronorubrum thiooxidans TaxID=308853 RepID=A0A1N7H255_9EURY|nr:ParB N-terminal domain-containing protein [Natronorubrum thiooxidans]SIS18911.1 ParB/RepB/Spo0J family partition protein [Natronorubrum thiooxidans]